MTTNDSCKFIYSARNANCRQISFGALELINFKFIMLNVILDGKGIECAVAYDSWRHRNNNFPCYIFTDMKGHCFLLHYFLCINFFLSIFHTIIVNYLLPFSLFKFIFIGFFRLFFTYFFFCSNASFSISHHHDFHCFIELLWRAF